jgi:four helix bundle protein
VKLHESFEDLDCWKAAARLRQRVREVTAGFPCREPLAENMQKTSRTITQKIAEGFGRSLVVEKVQLCRISRGLLFELADQYITALEEEFIQESVYREGRKQIQITLTLLNSYTEDLEKQANQRRSYHNYTLPLTINF